mgnify:FL=1|jgi:hypothetical protein
MKSLIIILSVGFLEMPFENKLTCMEQGSMWLDIHTKYQVPRPADQGLYTRQGKLVYGFFCI